MELIDTTRILVKELYRNGNTNNENLQKLLWKIKELCGPQESRYSAHRVVISIKPGDKHASHPDNQEEAE